MQTRDTRSQHRQMSAEDIRHAAGGGVDCVQYGASPITGGCPFCGRNLCADCWGPAEDNAYACQACRRAREEPRC